MKLPNSILVLLAFFYFNSIFADGGCCIKYKVNLTLKNDSIITGYYYCPCLDMDLELQSINKIINNKFSPEYFDFKDSIEIYKETISLYPFPMDEFKILTATSKNRIRISFNDIKAIEQLEKEGCYVGLENYEGYQSSGLYPTIITEFSDDEIAKMTSQKPINVFCFHKCECWNFTLIWVISYNGKYSQDYLDTLLEKRLCIKDKYQPIYIDYEASQQEYKILKQELSQLDIIIFKTKYNN